MIACLSVPYFAAAVERRDKKEPADTYPADKAPSGGRQITPGLVIGGQPWEPQPVYAFSHEAAQNGVKTGMSLRLAHVLSPDARFLPAVPARYSSASGEIAGVLTDFTHLIEPEDLWAQRHLWGAADQSERRGTVGGHSKSGPAPKPIPGAGSAIGAAFTHSIPARYTLDLESLPLPEALLLSREVGRTVRRHTRLAPAIGLAESKFTAQVAAVLARPNYARTVPPEQEATFLAARTIHFLPLDKEASRRLRLLGLRTLGQMAAIPLSTLQVQFGLQTSLGPAFTQLYRLLQGSGMKGGNPLLAVQPAAQEGQEWLSQTFDSPVDNFLILENVLGRLATGLAGRLQAAGLEGRTLHLAWQTATGRVSLPGFTSTGEKVTHRHPTADPGKLYQSLHELLRRLFHETTSALGPDDPFEGITSLTIVMSDLAPAVTTQPSLFGSTNMKNQIRETLKNTIARHGVNCFFRPELSDPSHPLPELRFRLQDLSPA